MKDHIFGTHHVFRLTPSQWALLAENCQPSLTRYLLALHVHQTNQASEGWKPTPNLEHDRFVRVATLQEIAQRLASLPEFCHQESGDGNRIAALVIETLASVLEGGFDEGARTAKTRQGVAGRVLSEHLQLLYRYLGTERDQLLKACLRLLTGVSSVSQSMSSQLLRTFNFAHEGFARLSQRRHQASKKDKGNRKEPSKVDTRTFFSRFATSFLRWKDPSLTSAALGIKDLIGGVLRGLSQDPPQEALAFVRDILELVVRQRQLPRQTKVFFFNAFALRNLASLLGSEDKQVSSTASTLLREVCCNGSLFPASKDAMLLDVCLELRAHEAQQDLVAAVLNSRPRLHLQRACVEVGRACKTAAVLDPDPD
ncbi:URB1 [Symbiodinium microadriaticum]|nr:URB1 [Symbiodinium microadriaticum]CAE7888094.1 URB1 [Symbiodinium sp. KB8]